ncbi:hypothetical protein LLE49_07310 [Alicyclobacillus tolerans]|uniref:hypothetical protein n=1 Tax=Alicyclobacillus tolerans TaxID=90970 RepID=UPI001F33D5FD|nr:hypothetical protein [Alicyclobacillus tolerans]MCF8564552.1 hypothetical protein [Alicyclobacillus tolerans]
MFIEKIDEQLLEEIREAMDEEYDQIVANWDGEFVDLENEDFTHTLVTEIYSDYLNIPLHTLMDMITHHFPFIKEKDISIDPYSEIITLGIVDNVDEVTLRVYADHFNLDRSRLTETELEQLDTLFAELTQLYQDLNVNTTLQVTHVPLENVPVDYYADRNGEIDEEEEHDFVQLEF